MGLNNFLRKKFWTFIHRNMAQIGVKWQKRHDFRFKTDIAQLPRASKSIKIIEKWMKIVDTIEITFPLNYFSRF